MTVKELLETKPHDYHLSHVYIYTDCLKQCRRMKFLDNKRPCRSILRI